MPDFEPTPVIARLARLAAPPDSDARLIERFASGDEAAFRALLDRYAGLVYGVCRRALGHAQDAEDAFQATFLVLARSAGRIRRPDALACWLHGVARRIANKARAARRRPPALPVRTEAPADAAAAWRELEAVLDEELARLPTRYREPLILCGLRDLSQEEAASRLGCPVGTLKCRLARGRERLRARLVRRGVSPVAVGLAWVLAADSTSATTPTGLLEDTMKGVIHPVPGSSAVRLADAALRSALRANLVVGGLSAGLLAVGLTLAGPGNGPPPPGPPSRPNGPPITGNPASKIVVDAVGDALPAGAAARLGTMRFRHMHTSPSVGFTTDGTAVVTRSWDDTSRVWSVPDGKELARVRLPRSEDSRTSPKSPRWAGIALDGKTELSFGSDGHFRATDVRYGRVLAELQLPDRQVPTGSGFGAFRPDGKVLGTLGDRRVRLLEVATGKEVAAFPVPYTEGDPVLSPDGKTVALVCRLPKTADGASPADVALWDASTGKELRHLKGHTDAIYRAAFSPNGSRLATGGGIKDKTVRIWDVKSGDELVRIPGPDGWVRPVAFSPDGQTLAAGGQDGIIRLYDAATGTERRRFVIPGQDDKYGPWVMSVSFSPDGKWLASTGTEKAVRIWDVATGKELTPAGGHQDEVTAVVVTPDSRTAISGGKDSAIIVWDLSGGRERARWLGHHNGVAGLALSPDGKTLVSVGTTVRVWDVPTGSLKRELVGHTTPVTAVTFAPDGRTVATASDGDHTIRVWDLVTGRQTQLINLPKSQNYGSVPLAYAAGGRLLVSGSGDRTNTGIYVWEVATGKEVRRLPGAVEHLAASPDGREVAAAIRDESVLFFDAESGADLGRIPAGGPLAFSPDGNTLAIGRGDGTAHLFEAATGFERRVLAGHQSGRVGRMTFATGVSCLAFTPDGRSLVTGAGDTTLLTWDVDPPRAEVAAAPERRSRWWDDLAAEPAVAARAMAEMGAAGRDAVTELKARLTPVPAPDASLLAGLIRRLDSDRFADREQATTALARLGELAVPAVTEALSKASSPEARARLEGLLAKAADRRAPGRLRDHRAIEILERARTAEAEAVLRAVAAGVEGADRTAIARAAVRRLERARAGH